MRLSLFKPDDKFYNFLQGFDNKIPAMENGKENRPFIGILLTINNMSYFAPLTSPKPKHTQMKNSLDFMKIDNGKLGAINFNNMIPAPVKHMHKIDLTLKSGLSKKERNTINLLKKQITWCNANRAKIQKTAENLYRLIKNNKAPENLLNRCCDFVMLEKACLNYK